jgi:hypothetical protein
VPGAAVYHPLRRDQLNRSYFLRRVHGIGRVHARLQRIRGARCRRFAGMTLYVFEYLGRTGWAYLRSLITGSPPECFYLRGELARYCGHLHEDLVAYWSGEEPGG